MRLIIGGRQSGRTTRLLEMAAKYQRDNDKHTCLIIAHTQHTAEWLAKEIMVVHVQDWFNSGGEMGLDPARTIVECAAHFEYRARGQWWSNDDGTVKPHHVFAFIDNVDLIQPPGYDILNQELTLRGVAVAAVTIEAK